MIPTGDMGGYGGGGGVGGYGTGGSGYGGGYGGGGGYGVEEVVYDDKGLGKEMGIKDIFEIALTTLAFLSFGMFILHVLMCITMVIYLC